ncbi:MAG: hypothetical protein HFK09_02160 [Clostridia bacterium]|nr:hypothetical protein [Clostridia bacterium]
MTFSFSQVPSCPKESVTCYAERLGTHGGAFLPYNLTGEVYEITADGAHAGFLFADGGVLGGFFLEPKFRLYAETAFALALKQLGITRARVLTSDSPLVALCCTRWTYTRASALCFEYVGTDNEPETAMLCANESDREELEAFGYISCAEVDRLMREKSIYVYKENGKVSAFGTAEWGEREGFIGVAVRADRRHCGIGRSVLARLGKMLADYSRAAIAVCSVRDVAFEKTLESAGYVCFDKVIDIEF